MEGKKIKQVRESKGMNQLELSQKSGVAQSFIHYIEKGQKSPTIRTLRKLAKAMEVPVVDLIGDEE